jgi:hypothetical protein
MDTDLDLTPILHAYGHQLDIQPEIAATMIESRPEKVRNPRNLS